MPPQMFAALPAFCRVSGTLTPSADSSERIVPMINENKEVVGMLNAESEKVNAFTADDRHFLERAASLIAHCLS